MTPGPRLLLLFTISLLLHPGLLAAARGSVRDPGVSGDGRTLGTAAVSAPTNAGGGALEFPGGARLRHSIRVPIDRKALVARHAPVVRSVDPTAPLTVGNGGFAFTVDVTGLQTFGEYYYRHGIPLETLARWCWFSEDNPGGFTLADAFRTYRRPDGSTWDLPSRIGTTASDWLRRNPRLQPLGQLSLVWDKPDGSALAPGDIEAPEQVLDLWRGVITSRYSLGGTPVAVTTRCDDATDTLSVRIESELLDTGRLRVRLAFPRGHDPGIKNTPPLDWSHPEAHESVQVAPGVIERRLGATRYTVAANCGLEAEGVHAFVLRGGSGGILAFSMRFSPEPIEEVPMPAVIEARATQHWARFWRGGAAVDFSGSTHVLAPRLERRIILSRYLTAVQCAGDVPPQESGLTCNTWYGKHHTEMIWWHTAHFILWGRPELADRSLAWFVAQLPGARALAAERGLRGARWAKMVGPDGRESPGGNPLIAWNQPHPIYLAELMLRQHPSEETLERYRELVQETAECLASMLVVDPVRGQVVLGPPLWIAQEIHDPATSQNPSFELAYWRWALETAQHWRLRAGLERNQAWDTLVERMPPLPQRHGRYVALESYPDTWDEIESRHDHPQMLMPLGFLPETPYVDRATMERTLDGVLREWDWQTKIWGWDYPMIAMTAARLGRAAEAVEILLRDGPNNRYLPNGHCPQGSDRAQASQEAGRREIAVYLPANGSFLAAVALMVAGWDGCTREHPGFPEDGTWMIRAEGLQRLP